MVGVGFVAWAVDVLAFGDGIVVVTIVVIVIGMWRFTGFVDVLAFRDNIVVIVSGVGNAISGINMVTLWQVFLGNR